MKGTSLYRMIVIVLWAAVLMPACLEADPIKDLEQSYLTRYDEANGKRKSQLEKLRDSYLLALKREMEKAQSSGKLEAVIPYRNEIAFTKEGKDPLPALPAGTAYQLKKMRGKFNEARQKILFDHATALVSLSDKMEEVLEQRETEYTKAGKIDEALAAKKTRETLAEDDEIKRAKEIISLKGLTTGDLQREWKSLSKSKMKILEKNPFPIGWLDDAMRPDIAKPLLAAIDKEAEGRDAFVSVPPAIVEFELRDPVTTFQATVFLASKIGDVEFRVLVDGRKVASKKLAGKVGGVEISGDFEPTQKITLEVDQNGSQNSDWAVWIDPQVQ